MNSSKNLGIKDIAALANVSIGTIDRVLHNRKGVSQKTKERVLKIIEETGFKKNVMASRLKLAAIKKINIAVLLPEFTNEMVYWNLTDQGIKKASDELFEQGVSINKYFFNLLNPVTFRGACSQIIEDGYDAIITVPFFEKEISLLLEKAKKNAAPVVFLDSVREDNLSGNYILQNSYRAGMVAGRLLHGLVGNEGQYFVFNIQNQRGIQLNNMQREMGFRAFFAQNFSECDIEIHSINHPLESKEELREEVLTLFDPKRKKGIFVSNARSFIVTELLEECQIPNTNIIGFDLNKRNVDGLNSGEIDFLINQQPEHQGYAAVKGLYKFITEQDSTELALNIPVEIIIKENVDFSGIV